MKDGSHLHVAMSLYSAYKGIDFIKNINIPTFDYATFHLHPDQREYDYSRDSKWIEQHSAETVVLKSII